MKTNLTSRELATVLAALRYWQREGLMSSGHEHDIASDSDSLEPLTADEIDDLCERINDGAEIAPLADNAELLAVLKQAVARVEIANSEGDAILSAWLPEAHAAVAKAEAAPCSVITVDDAGDVSSLVDEFLSSTSVSLYDWDELFEAWEKYCVDDDHQLTPAAARLAASLLSDHHCKAIGRC